MLLLVGLCGAAVVGCQDPDYPEASPSTTGYNTQSSRILITNASTASSITALLENVSAGSALTPGANTGYLAVPLGPVQTRILGSGGTLASVSDGYAVKSTVLANSSYTTFVTDSIARPRVTNAAGTVTDIGGVRTLTVYDTLTPPASGTARIRYFNLTPDLATASARLINSSGASATTLTNRAYRATSAAALRYTSVPVGAYVTQVYSGTAVPSSLTATPVTSTTVNLANGKIYTLYSRGLVRDRTATVSTVQHN